MFRPTKLLPSWCLTAVMLVLAAWSCGQETAGPRTVGKALPEAPADGLLDDGNVFNAEERVLVAAELEDFRHRAGMPAYVVTANYVFGDTVGQYGERLVTAWSKEKAGVVLLYECGSGKLNYSATPGALGRTEDMQALFLSASRSAAALPEEATVAQRLRAALHSLTLSAGTWKTTGPPPAPVSVPPSAESPAPPVDFVADEAGVFDLNEEAALKTELVKFHSKHGIDIYVATCAHLPDTSAQLQAERLALSWLAGRYGVVLVMNPGTNPADRMPGIAGAALNDQLLDSSALKKAVAGAKLKAREVAGTPQGSPALTVRAAADQLMQSFAAHSIPPETTAGTFGPWRIITAVAGVFVFGLALLFLFHRFQERTGHRPSEPLLFPDVTVGCRLGAPHGGGQVAGISFDKNQRP